jgi:hypothetical protein
LAHGGWDRQVRHNSGLASPHDARADWTGTGAFSPILWLLLKDDLSTIMILPLIAQFRP